MSAQTQSAAGASLPERQTDEQVSGAEGGSVRQNGARRQGGNIRGAAAAAVSTFDASGGHQPAPFHGFPREFVESHRRTAEQNIRHKEILIRLLSSGMLDDRQLRAILPPGELAQGRLV